MLDVFKNIAGGGKSKIVQQQCDELERLLAATREERAASSAMLTALTTGTAKLKPLSKSVEQVAEKAIGMTAKLEEITTRLTALDDRSREIAHIDKGLKAATEAAKLAEQAVQKAIGRDGELTKHREAIQQLSSQALQTQASLDTLKKEHAALEEFRSELREAQNDVKQSIGHAGALRGELDQIRATASSLAQDYTKIREISREAREGTTAAMVTIKEIEKKLEPLAQLHELSQSTEERLTAISALAFGNDAIVINSFSKFFSMMGWRLGWMVVPEELFRSVDCLSQNLYISAPTLSQRAALKAFDCMPELQANVQRFARNRAYLLEHLPRAGFDRLAPADGAFYLYADVRHLTNDSEEFCRRILADTGVAVTPGVDFDPMRGSGFVRFSYAGAENHMAEAAHRLEAWRRH